MEEEASGQLRGCKNRRWAAREKTSPLRFPSFLIHRRRFSIRVALRSASSSPATVQKISNCRFPPPKPAMDHLDATNRDEKAETTRRPCSSTLCILAGSLSSLLHVNHEARAGALGFYHIHLALPGRHHTGRGKSSISALGTTSSLSNPRGLNLRVQVLDLQLSRQYLTRREGLRLQEPRVNT